MVSSVVVSAVVVSAVVVSAVVVSVGVLSVTDASEVSVPRHENLLFDTFFRL